MEKHIKKTLDGMAKSQEELARTLKAEKDIVARMAYLIRSISVRNLPQSEGDPYTEAARSVAKQVSSYLHSLGDLEHALADHVKAAIKELRIAENE